MSQELTLNVGASYSDANDVEASIDLGTKLVNVSTKVIARHSQSIATSETAINLGSVAVLGFVVFINRDATNYIEIKNVASGVVIGKMLPGEPYGPVRIGSGITAPVAIANTGACIMDTLICSA